MKRTFYWVGFCALAFAPCGHAFGQVMIPSCPSGSHVEILDSAELSALKYQAISLDAEADNLRKQQQTAKDDNEAAQDQLAADQTDQNKSAAVSAMLIEQGRNMRCIAN